MNTFVHVCKPIAQIVREVADKTTGEPPDAITLGTVVFLFTKPDGLDWMRLVRHEQRHQDQMARLAPRWARWLPKSARVWLGTPRFLTEYYSLYTQYGYWDNPLEQEARAAE